MTYISVVKIEFAFADGKNKEKAEFIILSKTPDMLELVLASGA